MQTNKREIKEVFYFIPRTKYKIFCKQGFRNFDSKYKSWRQLFRAV